VDSRLLIFREGDVEVESESKGHSSHDLAVLALLSLLLLLGHSGLPALDPPSPAFALKEIE
jgi:hypothetical protein